MVQRDYDFEYIEFVIGSSDEDAEQEVDYNDEIDEQYDADEPVDVDDEPEDVPDLMIPAQIGIAANDGHTTPADIVIDFTVIIGDAHLSTNLALLQSHARQFQNCQPYGRIVLPQEKVPFFGFVQLYEWMMCKDIDLNIVYLVDQLKAGLYLEVRERVNELWGYIDENYREAAAFKLYLEAVAKQGVELLEELMLGRISKYFLVLVSLPQFLRMSLKAVCWLLDSREVAVNSELEVFYAAVLWLMHAWDARKEHVKALMSCVRFGYIPLSNLRKLMQPVNQAHLLMKDVLLNDDMYNCIDQGCRQSAVLRDALNTGAPDWNFLNARIGSARQFLINPYAPYHRPQRFQQWNDITMESFVAFIKQQVNLPSSYWQELHVRDDDWNQPKLRNNAAAILQLPHNV